MPLSRHALLAAPQAIDLTVDPRWTMAFAAGIPDDSPTLFDTAGTLMGVAQRANLVAGPDRLVRGLGRSTGAPAG